MSFPAYEAYKDSGVSWLGEIPSHWTTKRVAYFFDERREKVSDKDFEPLSVTKNGVLPQLDTAAKSDDGDNRKLVRAGDFVINSRSDRKGSAGISDRDGSVSLINTVIRPTSEVNPPYAHYLLRSVSFQEEFYRYGKGIVADLWSTNYSEMKNIVLAIPSYAEQANIAAFLDRETAKIDTLVQEQQRLIELLKEKRQAVISHSVTKGLNPDAPMKDSGVEWLGKVPEHWLMTHIKRLTSIISKGTTPTTIGIDFTDEGVRFLKAENISDGKVALEPLFFISPEGHATLRRSDLHAYDVLVVIAGATTGKSAVLSPFMLPANTNQAVAFVRPITSDDAEWIHLWLSTDAVQRLVSLSSVQSAQPNLSMEDLGNICIPYPPSTERDLIISEIRERTNAFSELIFEAEKAISLLQERRSALISATVTGKIDVRGLASNEAEAA